MKEEKRFYKNLQDPSGVLPLKKKIPKIQKVVSAPPVSITPAAAAPPVSITPAAAAAPPAAAKKSDGKKNKTSTNKKPAGSGKGKKSVQRNNQKVSLFFLVQCLVLNFLYIVNLIF